MTEAATPPLRRAVHLLLADASAGAIVVGDHGRLPEVAVSLQPDDTTVIAVRRTLGEMGIDAPIVDVLFDEEGMAAPDDGTPIPTLVVAGPASAAWQPPPQWSWQPVALPPPHTVTAFHAAVDARVAEWAGTAVPPPRRQAWGHLGWWTDMEAWVHSSLARHGITPTGPLQQVRLWGISAIVRVATDHGTVWGKEVFTGFAHEPALTRLVADRVPHLTPRVIEADGPRLLLHDVGTTFHSSHMHDIADPLAALWEVQQTVSADDALAAGAPDRRLAALPNQLRDALLAPEVQVSAGLDAAAVEHLTAWVAQHAAAVAHLPDVLVHGDFHPGNVADGPVIIDWSDAAVANPLVDAPIWEWWLGDGAMWAALCQHWQVDDTPELRGVMSAYHVVSYAHILHRVEPAARYQHADGLHEHLGIVRRAAGLG